jgi:ATP-dependent DNA helicase RecG
LEELHAVQRWENQPAEGWSVARLDAREMVQTLEEAIRRGRSEDPGTREPLEILRGMNLLTESGELLRAAVVLFCKEDGPSSDFPQLLLKVARFKGVTRDEFLDNRQFGGNAFSLMRKAERFLIESLPIAGRIVPGRMEREDTPLFPVEALREALANAFVHRDYATGSGSVAIALYDDRLEIISIGDLHFGLTPEKLLQEHESRPWNPLIAQVFYRRGIIETWGRGTLKIARLMREAGLEPPITTVRTGAVVVTFDVAAARAARGWPAVPQVGAKSRPSRDQAGIRSGETPEKNALENAPENAPENALERGIKTPAAILSLLSEEPELSFAQIATKLGKSDSAIKRAVRKLREAGRLERIGPDKGGYWKVLENSKKKELH